MGNEITSSTVARAITRMVATDALPALMGNLIMGNLVNRNFETIIKNAGDTVDVPIPPIMVANNIADAGSVQNQNPSPGNASIVLDTHAEATFTITDIAKVLANPDLLKMYMDPAIIALSEKVEGDLLNLYPLFTNNAVQGAYNTAITEAVLEAAETAMFDAKVPQSAAKYLVVNGTTYSQLRQIPRFSEMQTAGTSLPIQTGEVGKLKDMFVFRSQYVNKSGNNTNNLAFASDAMALVTRRLPQPLPGTGAIAEYVEMNGIGMRVVMSYNPNTLAQQFTVDMLYGVGVLRNSFGVQVRS